jgi:hypothetical protein
MGRTDVFVNVRFLPGGDLPSSLELRVLGFRAAYALHGASLRRVPVKAVRLAGVSAPVQVPIFFGVKRQWAGQVSL